MQVLYRSVSLQTFRPARWLRSSEHLRKFSLRAESIGQLAQKSETCTDQSPLEKKRIFGIAAHIDCGKTTTSESILYHAGAIRRRCKGNVDTGNTVMDYLPMERERGITISSASTTFKWKCHQFFLVDSPGHLDFTFEVERALRVMDGVVILLDAVAGIQPQTETVWRQADRNALPCVILVNKMDRQGADLKKVIMQLKEQFSITPALVQHPVLNSDGTISQLYDLLPAPPKLTSTPLNDSLLKEKGLKNSYDGSISAGIREAIRERERLIETLAEVDDGIMELWMEGRDVSEQAVKIALRKACVDRTIVPVLCGSALKDIGVIEVMDAIVSYLPSPSDRPPADASDANGLKVLVHPDLNATFRAQAFKVTHDAHRGRLVHFRAFSGALETRKLPILNISKQIKERPSKWLHILADDDEEIERIEAGDIFAMTGLKHTETGDTISIVPPKGEDGKITFDRMRVPAAVCSVALETESNEQQEELDALLENVLVEDPSLRLSTDTNTGQTLLSGVGTLHLDSVHQRLETELSFPVTVSPPRIAYRETITQAVTHEEHYNSQIGGTQLSASVKIVLTPCASAGDPNTVNVDEECLSAEIACAICESAIAALARGSLHGFPGHGIQAKISQIPHTTATNAVAIRACVSSGIATALSKAMPVLLEPVMSVTVVVPGPLGGDITSELSHPRRMRGSVEDVEMCTSGSSSEVAVIRATVPLEGMLGWATRMRTICKGRGDFSMELEEYRPVPEVDRIRLAQQWNV